MPSCIRDGAPDAWGRRGLINKKLGLKGRGVENAQLDELTYLLESAEHVEKGIPLTPELDQAYTTAAPLAVPGQKP